MDRHPSEQREFPERPLNFLASAPEKDRPSEFADDSLETPGLAPEVPPANPPPAEPSLPESYGETNLAAVPVNPFEVHCHWEVAPADMEKARRTLGVGEGEFWPVLRIQEVAVAVPEGASQSSSFDVEIELQARNWYVRSCAPDRSYRAELAFKSEDGSFVVVASSDAVHTPPARPSTQADEAWAPIHLNFPPPLNVIPPTPHPGAENEFLSSGEPYMAEPPGSLPIDMQEEIRSKLVALYGERAREDPRPPARHQFPVPVDITAELQGEPAARDRDQEYDKSGRIRAPSPGSNLVFGEFAFESSARQPATTAAMKSGKIFDLTSLNEMRFSPGASSRTK